MVWRGGQGRVESGGRKEVVEMYEEEKTARSKGERVHDIGKREKRDENKKRRRTITILT